MMADQDAHPAHLNARDTTFARISRAPQENIERLKAQMGWELIPWYTITDEFDKEFDVDEMHGTNAFFRDDDDRIFRTYFVDERGDEALGSTWSYLDITALGRQESFEDSPEGYPQDATFWLEAPRRVRAVRGEALVIVAQVQGGRSRRSRPRSPGPAECSRAPG